MNRRVLVTGASSGIGRETALLLAETGASLVLTGRRTDKLDEVARECGPSAEVVPADLATESGRDAVLERFGAGAQGLYPVLVNAAGASHFGDFATMTMERVEEQIAVNLLAPMALTHGFLSFCELPGGGLMGQVVNVASIAAKHAFPSSAAYCASKAGLLMFSRSLAAEYRAKGLRVTAVIPGSTDTPLWEGKDWSPAREDMLTARAVAEVIRDVILSPSDRNLDEIVVMPPKGIL